MRGFFFLRFLVFFFLVFVSGFLFSLAFHLSLSLHVCFESLSLCFHFLFGASPPLHPPLPIQFTGNLFLCFHPHYTTQIHILFAPTSLHFILLLGCWVSCPEFVCFLFLFVCWFVSLTLSLLSVENVRAARAPFRSHFECINFLQPIFFPPPPMKKQHR